MQRRYGGERARLSLEAHFRGLIIVGLARRHSRGLAASAALWRSGFFGGAAASASTPSASPTATRNGPRTVAGASASGKHYQNYLGIYHRTVPSRHCRINGAVCTRIGTMFSAAARPHSAFCVARTRTAVHFRACVLRPRSHSLFTSASQAHARSVGSAGASCTHCGFVERHLSQHRFCSTIRGGACWRGMFWLVRTSSPLIKRLRFFGSFWPLSHQTRNDGGGAVCIRGTCLSWRHYLRGRGAPPHGRAWAAAAAARLSFRCGSVPLALRAIVASRCASSLLLAPSFLPRRRAHKALRTSAHQNRFSVTPFVALRLPLCLRAFAAANASTYSCGSRDVVRTGPWAGVGRERRVLPAVHQAENLPQNKAQAPPKVLLRMTPRA